MYVIAILICRTPCFILMPIFICHMPILVSIVSSFVCNVLKFLYVIPILFQDMSISIQYVAWQLMCGMLKFAHVASLFIYARPRFPFFLYFLLSFLLYLHKFMLYQHNKFMLYQDFSVVPLFPSPQTVRSYHNLQLPVVLRLYSLNSSVAEWRTWDLNILG